MENKLKNSIAITFLLFLFWGCKKEIKTNSAIIDYSISTIESEIYHQIHILEISQNTYDYINVYEYDFTKELIFIYNHWDKLTLENLITVDNNSVVDSIRMYYNKNYSIKILDKTKFTTNLINDKINKLVNKFCNNPKQILKENVLKINPEIYSDSKLQKMAFLIKMRNFISIAIEQSKVQKEKKIILNSRFKNILYNNNIILYNNLLLRQEILILYNNIKVCYNKNKMRYIDEMQSSTELYQIFENYNQNKINEKEIHICIKNILIKYIDLQYDKSEYNMFLKKYIDGLKYNEVVVLNKLYTYLKFRDSFKVLLNNTCNSEINRDLIQNIYLY